MRSSGAAYALKAMVGHGAWFMGTWFLVTLHGALGAGSANAGECVDATYAPAIIKALANANVDSLPPETRYLLGCLDYPVSRLRWRPPRNLPSWRLLRNTRRTFRDLGRDTELVAALQRAFDSKDRSVRRSAGIALALYGHGGYRDSLHVRVTDIPSRAMLLAVLGDTSGVSLAISTYPVSRTKMVLLDALYYQDTPGALTFIQHIAQHEDDVAIRKRARWMIQNPIPSGAAWKI